MKQRNTSDRRTFLKRTAAIGLGAAGLPYLVPASALGKNNRAAPSDRVVMGCIGTGGQGSGNMRAFMGQPEVQVVAVCDVDTGHRERAKDAVNKKYGNQDCKTFKDFRELLQIKDIDAVSIATPDHWHALTSIAAANAGKDIYCEKPLANSVGEGRAICEAVRRNNVVLQCGSHERSNSAGRRACELVRNGRIGKLHTLRVNLPHEQGHHQRVLAMEEKDEMPAPAPVPDGFDYDFWLGHTPMVPYTPMRCHFWWRFILAHGGGEMTDRGAHVIDIGQLGAGKDDTGPVEIEASGWHSTKSLFDAFFKYKFVNTFADGLKLIGSTDLPRGVKFEGEDGWIMVHIHGCGLTASNPDVFKEKIGENEIQLGRSPGHHRNFLDCVKSRADTVATAEIGHRTGSICHLNNIAMLLGRKLKWDPVKEQVVGDEEATALLTPKMRDPWHL
jgi:predicted dehydrogenase